MAARMSGDLPLGRRPEERNICGWRPFLLGQRWMDRLSRHIAAVGASNPDVGRMQLDPTRRPDFDAWRAPPSRRENCYVLPADAADLKSGH